MSITSVEERVNKIVTPKRFGTRDELETLRTGLTDLTLRGVVGLALTYVQPAHLQFVNIFNGVGASHYDEAVAESLAEYKTAIDQEFSDTLGVYQKAKKDCVVAEQKLVALQASKDPDKDAIEEQISVVAELNQKKADSFETFMNARRAEQVIRSVPVAYKSGSVEDALWVLGQVVQVSYYTPAMGGADFRSFVKTYLSALFD